MSVAADQRPTAATNTSIYYTSYTVGNVSLGLAHGMEGILHVVTVARDNTVERHRRFALNGPALDGFTSQRASSSVTHIGFCFCFPKMGRLMTSLLQEVPVLGLSYGSLPSP
jgi:acyl-CoA thioesterase